MGLSLNVSSKFPGDADAAGPGPTLGESLVEGWGLGFPRTLSGVCDPEDPGSPGLCIVRDHLPLPFPQGLN